MACYRGVLLEQRALRSTSAPLLAARALYLEWTKGEKEERKRRFKLCRLYYVLRELKRVYDFLSLWLESREIARRRLVNNVIPCAVVYRPRLLHF